MDWYDLLRLGAILHSVVALVALSLAWHKRSKTYSPRLKDFWWALTAMLGIVIVASVEGLVHDDGITYTLVVSFFASIVVLKASLANDTNLLHIPKKTQTPPVF